MRLKASWAIDSEAMSKIQLVGQKYRDKTTLVSKTLAIDSERPLVKSNQLVKNIETKQL